MKFSFAPQEISEVLLVEHQRFGDERGFFAETYRENVFSEHGISGLVQDNHSRSTRGTLRGLHFQNEPESIGKLVRCTAGKVFDVAVDLRKNSPTYARWVARELDGTDNFMLWIPAGFAHGFVALSDAAELSYRTTGYYSPEHDRAVAWNDPEIGIDWPIDEPTLSEKDAAAPKLRECDVNFVYSI